MAFDVFAVSISRHCFHHSPTFPHSFGPACGQRQFTAGEPIGPDLSGQSAYDVLGVREGSSIAEIKASFRRLAKECHPDINPSAGSSASHRFLIVLAAYEILSDSERRAQYDSYLISKRKVLRNQNPMHATGSELFVKEDMPDQGEVAEWLIWYRLAIKDILLEKRVPTGSGYFHDFENELYEAIRAAYYGPIIESMELLPDCFEAEERSVYETSEVLHLVSGRDLFGIVKLIGRVPQLSNTHPEKLTSSSSMHRGVCDSLKDGSLVRDSKHIEGAQNSRNRFTHFEGPNSDAYKDLELYVYGELVASATRTPSKVNCVENCEVEANDIIRIYLNRNYSGNTSEEYYPRQLVGTVEGLGSSPEEGSCFVYNGNSEKTHVIMKHRTLLVKHLHWYQIGDRVSTCECRCSRARLPSSKFWLFEPRCGLHDIGGWYIETFGRDKSGKTILCQRQWDSAVRIQDKRLHPAMYLLTLAYRTLDIEVTKRRKQTLTNIIRPRLNYVLQWCKKCV